jgi:hypothetical protein
VKIWAGAPSRPIKIVDRENCERKEMTLHISILKMEATSTVEIPVKLPTST